MDKERKSSRYRKWNKKVSGKMPREHKWDRHIKKVHRLLCLIAWWEFKVEMRQYNQISKCDENSWNWWKKKYS